MRKLLENGTSSKVAEASEEIGYAHVTLDLQGYRRGSANEVLQSPDLRQVTLRLDVLMLCEAGPVEVGGRRPVLGGGRDPAYGDEGGARAGPRAVPGR